jgi:hypothetical protein
MDVLMPDGTTITGVPEGITQSELLARYGKYSSSGANKGLASLAKPEPTLSPEEQMMGVIGAAPAPQEQIPRLPGDQSEMRPYEPSLSEQLIGLLPGNKAKAANEYAARKIAEEKGISVGQVYKDIGGSRPVFNPEGRAPIRAGVESAEIVAGELPKVPQAALSTFLKAYRAGDIEAPTDTGMVDKAIAAMKPTDAKGKPDPNYEAFQGLGESLGFSLATMVTSATAAAAGELAGPATAVAAGMGASGALAYRASKDDFLSRVRDKLNNDSQKLYGKNISQEDWNKAKKEFDQAAIEYGAWEAIPEAVSNAVFLKAFAAPVRASGRGVKEISNIMEKLGAQGVEQATETVTNLGQNAAELKAGLTDEEMNLADAFRQQFLQTLLIGGVMSGGMKAKEIGEKYYQDVVEPRVRPGSALAKAIQADIDAVAFNPESTRQAAVQALNPNRAQQQVTSEPGIASLIQRPQVAMPPPPEEPVPAEKITAPPSASQDTEAMLREILGPDTNTVSVEKPAEVPAFKAPAGFAYSVTQSPAYEGVEPLSADDAQFELEALLESARRGRMTPERFAQSEIGQRLGTGQVMVINEGIKANPIATIEALMQKIAPAEQTPTAQTTEETKPEKKTEVEQTQLPGRMTVEVPVSQLQLSEDVPQFKADANKEGIVEPLGGKFERTGVAPIQVWRREDGRMEVISGRHRFDLAKRSGEETIPAQIHDEKAGFTKDMAAVLDAELNIRDGQGKVKDYVNYFKGTGLDQETAESRGLLARSPGKRAFTIANQGSDELIAGVRSDKVGDEAAYLIALNAPNDPRLQGVGIKAIQDGKSSSNAVNLMQAVKALASEADTTTDMFGFDDSAMKEAEDMAKIAASKQREVQTRLSAITGAAKNPAVAKAEGIDVRDPEAVKRRINELRQLKTSWDNWSTNPNLISEIRTARGAPAPELQLRGETEAEIRQREATQEKDKAAAEQKAIADREVDMFKLQPQVAEKGEAQTMDMFGGADMANQPAQTKQAPEITEGLFAQKLQTEQERTASMTKKQFREDKETRGKTDHPALKMVFKDQTPKGLIEKYGEKDVRFLGRLFDIDVKDKFNVAKKLIAINSGLDLVRGKTKADFDKMNKAQLGEFLTAIGQSAYGQKYQLVERLLKYEDNVMGKFNDNLQDLKHKAAILNEARAGKSISEEVLKDYPDVAAYTLPRGSDGYKDAVHRLAIKYLPTHGMDTPSVINSFREDAKNTKDALEKNVANDIADDMEKYYQSQQKKSNETMAKLGEGNGPTMSEMIAENKRVKAQLAELEKGEEPKDNKKEIADLRKEQKSLMMQIVKAGMEETPVQEARMAEIEKRIAELEGKPVKAEKPKETRSVEEIEAKIENLQDKLANEFNKDKRMALIKEIAQQQTDLGAAEYRAAQEAEEEPKSTGSKSLDAFRGVKFTPDEDDKKAIAIYKKIKENNPEADVDDEIANPNGHLPIEEKENAKGIKIGDLIYEKGDPNPSIAITVSEDSVTTVNQKTGAQDGSKDIDSISKEPIPYDFSFDFGYGEINVNVNRWMNRKGEWSVEMQGPGASDTGYLSALAVVFKGERGTPAFENWVEQVVRAQTKDMAKVEKPKKAKEPKAPKGTVATPDGAVLRYPVAVSLVDDGYKVLALDDPRTYKDKGGNPHRTFERGPLRIAMTPQRTLFQNRNAVNTGFGNSDDLTLEAIMVEPGKRNTGLATQGMQDVVDAADKNKITLYLEPVPIVDVKKNDFGLDRDQLVDFYSKFGFEFQEDSNKVMERAPNAEVEVLPAEEPKIAGQLENEPYTFEGQFTEIGDEEQRTLITDQSSKLSDAQINTLEKEYGAKNGSDEFFESLRKDVIAYVTQGAKAVSGKIRAIIRQMANGLLSVAIVFNPQFVSQPYTIAVPQYDIRTSEVVKDLPKEAQSMSDAAKRAYGVIYPTLEAELKEKNKLFIVADKQSANTYIFQPDGSLLLQSKTLFGAGIGDFMKGDNNIVSNRITPAGLFDLGMRDAKRSASEEYMYGDYDFGKVFVLDKSYMGRNGPYSQLVMHSVWTNEKDAKQRLAALDKPGAEDSRYSFGCINVNKETFRNLITNHLGQMDGAKIFIVPENGSNVMDFVNGKATYSEDIIRQRVTPVTKTTKIEKQRAAPKTEERTLVAKEEEPGQYMSLESPNIIQIDGRSIPVTKHRLEKENKIVNVNTDAFDNAFANTKWQYIGEGGEGGIGDRYKTFANFIKTAKSIEAPNVSVNKDGAIVFGDGRHRYAYLRDAGLKNIPLSMDAESIKNAQKFGYISEPINMSLEDDLVKLVNDIADSIDENEKERSPSLKRKIKTLTNQRNEGKLTDEEYLDRVNAAIELDEENRLKQKPAERVRGADFIRQKLLEAKRKGFISEKGVDLAEWFIQQNPALVDDLGISVKAKGPEGAGGFYNSMARIINLMKDMGTDVTATHEILHHLERMMPAKIQNAIRKAWLTQLLKANKAATDPAEKLYFAALLDAHIGNNNHDRLEIPKGSEKIYEDAVRHMKFVNEMRGGRGANPKSIELAKELLINSRVSIDLYQYFDASEFWAVNGARIVEARYDAIQGGVLSKLKNWLSELGQKIKSVFGLKSDASVLRALNSLSKADGKFVTKEMLGTGQYQNISKNFRGGEMPEATWAMKESNNFDDWLYIWQDNYRDLKNVQKIINDQIGKIDDRLNAYRKETLNPGREAEQAQEFLKYEVDPLVKAMRDSNVSNKELATYLHNRYAEERNEIINAKNKSPAVQDQGSGIKTEKAREYLDKLPADRKQVLENLAKQIDKIVRGTQEILVTSGQETQETIDGWRKESPHYVPLSRDESELDFIVQTGGGNLGGYATAGKFGKEAMGSTKTVVNILENVMLQRDRAIRRAESIRIGQALYGMAIKYPNPNFWMAINPDAIKDKDALVAEMEAMGLDPELIENLLEQPKTAFVSKKTGAEGETIRDVKYRVNRSYQNARNVFPIRINGQNRFVLFNPRSPEAMRLAAELKQLDSEKLGVFSGAASTLSRWFAAVNTQYNPAFGLVNIFNDTQGALVNLSTTPLAGQQKQVLKDVFPAIRGIARDIRKERKETTKRPIKTSYDVDNLKPDDWTDLWRLFRQTGGKTGFRDQMVRQKMNVEWKGFVPKFSFEDEHAMLVAMEKLEQGPIRQKVEWWADAFSDFNDTLENTVRLSTFKVAYLDNNLSAEEAAEIAKNITVNFNKRGARTKHIRGLYAFFNASLQGTARYAITLAGPAGKTIIKTGLAMGALNAMWMFLAGFDDDDPPQFTKNKGFIIPTFDGNYFIWNLPPGLRAIPNTGRLLTEGMLISLGLMKSNRGMAGKISDASSVIVDAVNPFGGGTFMQTIAPTFLDPAVALAENKDSFGRPIFKEDQSLKPKPGWQRTRETASEFSKQLAYFINYISTGGEEFSKGFPSPTGDQLDYLIGQATGGIGRELKRAGEFVANKVSGEETPAYRVPFANRFYGETKTDAATSARFYDNVTMLADHLNNINGRIENKGDVQGYMNKNPISKLSFASEDFEKDVSSINQDITALQKMEQTPERKAQIKQLKEARIKIMTIFNDLVRQAQ